jgi:hypothetical protein
MTKKISAVVFVTLMFTQISFADGAAPLTYKDLTPSDHDVLDRGEVSTPSPKMIWLRGRGGRDGDKKRTPLAQSPLQFYIVQYMRDKRQRLDL